MFLSLFVCLRNLVDVPFDTRALEKDLNADVSVSLNTAAGEGGDPDDRQPMTVKFHVSRKFVGECVVRGGGVSDFSELER